VSGRRETMMGRLAAYSSTGALACRHAAAALLLSVLASCGSPTPPPPLPPLPPPPPPPTVVLGQVITGANVNPDVNGRPSPVVVRIYDLKSISAFDSAEFFSLWDKDQATLGPEMISREEYLMTPGEQKRFERAPTDGSGLSYLGVVAAFRDLEHARWRAAVAVPHNRTTRVIVTVNGHDVAVEAK